METIVYSSSHRQASNYQADRVCLAHKVDIPHLLHTEMQQCNIQHLHLWFVASNLDQLPSTGTQQVLLTIGKHFLQQHNELSLECLLQRYASPVLSQTSPLSFSNRFSTHTETSPNRESQERPQTSCTRDSLERSELGRQSIKFLSFKQFQLFIFQEQIIEEEDAVRTYTFRGKAQTIKVSFIAQHQKQLARRIVDQNNDLLLDAKIRYKKRNTLTSVHISPAFASSLLPTFHNKLILYVFPQETPAPTTSKTRLRSQHSTQKSNLSVQVLEQWRIKQGSGVDQVSKLEKEYQLLRQEIENQRLVFRQKIRCLENTLGQTINLDKLLHQEQDDMHIGCNMTVNAHKADKGAFCRKQRPSNVLSSPSTNKLGIQTTEFKRLKQVSDAIKNAQATIIEQNKKMEQQKARLKELTIEKDKTVYAQSKAMNSLRTQIQQLKRQIERKEMEIEEKRNNGVFQMMRANRNRNPTSEAQATIQQYSQFLTSFQKDNQNNSKNGSFLQAKPSSTLQVSPAVSRTVHKSLHADRPNPQKDLLLRQRQSKLKEVENTKLLELQRKNKENLMLKKIFKKQYSLGQAEEVEIEQPADSDVLSSQLMEQLAEVFKYYSNNLKAINMAKKDIRKYHMLHHSTNPDKQPEEVKEADFPLLFENLSKGEKPERLESGGNSLVCRDQVQPCYRDCFEWAIGKERRKAQPCNIPANNNNRASGSGYTASISSFKSELIDQILQKTQLAKVVPKKQSIIKQLPRNKRMTIEETISLTSNLRFNSFQRAPK